ncbi:S-adenosyl-L-methionine-dependent methyltransferase [Annulohypoxylon maeteangense]|uniref:S-adenosyl-L-methionine-dependent methyltransferase n=1 Tax=Annulohypoxylon maeteangense TaxID=1927788 RepID=UPI0020075228|nr:S-adenosyl-L-methionine-dependent methyltransferase [Annulohypoxylon maeteangense]KAI0885902.1 S-adenosyl-L-methionine-dependent methyltransferase [Annulohypoxylon maeteangense]
MVAQTRTLESAVAVLEKLASDPTATRTALGADNELRKRLLSATLSLIPELETSAEACQRFLYNILELPMARIAVDLNIFSLLKESSTPLSTAELAKQTGKNPNPKLLARVLRYLASLSFIREVDSDIWTASHLGNNLLGKGQSAGVASMVDNCGLAMLTLPAFLRRHNYNPPEDKSDTAFAQGNRVAPEEVTFFQWLKNRPENAKDFNIFMTSHRTGVKTWFEQSKVIEEITDAFEKVTVGKEGGKAKGVSFVDIGGGIGHQCKAFKKQVPDLGGTIVLEDLEEVVANAELEDGIEKVGVDFLAGQPVKGAASYYFRSVLRNWPDQYARTILGHVRDAMDEHSLLLIDELVLPDRGAHRYETQLDLAMLAMLNAEARTRTHWNQLLAEVGFEVKDIVFYEEEAREAVIIAKKISS